LSNGCLAQRSRFCGVLLYKHEPTEKENLVKKLVRPDAILRGHGGLLQNTLDHPVKDEGTGKPPYPLKGGSEGRGSFRGRG
jgi:hypothetical protein